VNEFDNNSIGDDHEGNLEAEELRRQIEKIHKKLIGEDTEPVTNNEILQFIRMINYNFMSLAKLLQTILLKNVEMDTTLINLELSVSRINKHLQQFFETNSMLDEVMKRDSFIDVSGSAPDNKFII